MIKIIKKGRIPKPPTTRVECGHCGSILEVGDNEWRSSDYGGYSSTVGCPCCQREITKPRLFVSFPRD